MMMNDDVLLAIFTQMVVGFKSRLGTQIFF